MRPDPFGAPALQHIFLGLLILLTLLAPLVSRADDGVLQRVREEVHAERKSEARGGDSDRCSSADDEWINWWAILGLPFWLPCHALDDHLIHFPNPDFHAPHPYTGYSRHFGKPDWTTRVSLDASNDFDGLTRVNGRLLLHLRGRFGLDTGWTYLHERLPGDRSDNLVLGDANLVLRFAQNEQWQFRTGLGARVLADQGNARFGFNFTYGADFFPAKPFVFSGDIDLGTLGSAGVVHGRLTGGITRNGWELFAGYDYLQIGRVDLQGPVVGLRYWF
jgi:hypothetical protein